MSHNHHSRNKLGRKCPLLQRPFAYTVRNNTVFPCSRCSQKSKPCGLEMQVRTCARVPAHQPSFETFLIRCSTSMTRNGHFPQRLVALCSCHDPNPQNREAPARGGAGKGQRLSRAAPVTQRGPVPGQEPEGAGPISRVGKGSHTARQESGPRGSPSFPDGAERRR